MLSIIFPFCQQKNKYHFCDINLITFIIIIVKFIIDLRTHNSLILTQAPNSPNILFFFVIGSFCYQSDLQEYSVSHLLIRSMEVSLETHLMHVLFTFGRDDLNCYLLKKSFFSFFGSICSLAFSNVHFKELSHDEKQLDEMRKGSKK